MGKQGRHRVIHIPHAHQRDDREILLEQPAQRAGIVLDDVLALINRTKSVTGNEDQRSPGLSTGASPQKAAAVNDMFQHLRGDHRLERGVRRRDRG